MIKQIQHISQIGMTIAKFLIEHSTSLQDEVDLAIIDMKCWVSILTFHAFRYIYMNDFQK